MQVGVCLAENDVCSVAHQSPINLNASTGDENGYLIISVPGWNFLWARVFLQMIYVWEG